jgi:UDP-N-acetyl-2-amino-2-deoxyglucuronate dehydrogenase
MKKLKTAIIGCGKVAHLHARGLINLEMSEFVAVWSRTFVNAQAFAKKYKVKAYPEIKDLIRDAKIDVAVICTAHPFHSKPAIECMGSGVHVLVEKPLASSLIDCDNILGKAKASRVKLGVISQRRFYQPCQRIRSAIDAGKIGKPILGIVTMYGWRDRDYYEGDAWRGNWKNEGGGVLVNQAPHQLDLLQWYMGPIDELFGFWDNFNHPYIEVDDTALAVIRFKNGGLGNITVSNSQNPALYGKISIHGSNGASIGAQTEGGSMFIAGVSTINTPPVNDVWTVPGEEAMLDRWQKEDTAFFSTINPMEYYIQLQIKDFLMAIINNSESLVTGEDGRKVVEIITAIYRSQRDKKPIKFPLQPEYNRNDFDGRIAYK